MTHCYICIRELMGIAVSNKHDVCLINVCGGDVQGCMQRVLRTDVHLERFENQKLVGLARTRPVQAPFSRDNDAQQMCMVCASSYLQRKMSEELYHHTDCYKRAASCIDSPYRQARILHWTIKQELFRKILVLGECWCFPKNVIKHLSKFDIHSPTWVNSEQVEILLQLKNIPRSGVSDKDISVSRLLPLLLGVDHEFFGYLKCAYSFSINKTRDAHKLLETHKSWKVVDTITPEICRILLKKYATDPNFTLEYWRVDKAVQMVERLISRSFIHNDDLQVLYSRIVASHPRMPVKALAYAAGVVRPAPIPSWLVAPSTYEQPIADQPTYVRHYVRNTVEPVQRRLQKIKRMRRLWGLLKTAAILTKDGLKTINERYYPGEGVVYQAACENFHSTARQQCWERLFKRQSGKHSWTSHNVRAVKK